MESGMGRQEKEDVESLETMLIVKAMFGGVADADVERLHEAQKKRREP